MWAYCVVQHGDKVIVQEAEAGEGGAVQVQEQREHRNSEDEEEEDEEEEEEGVLFGGFSGECRSCFAPVKAEWERCPVCKVSKPQTTALHPTQNGRVNKKFDSNALLAGALSLAPRPEGVGSSGGGGGGRGNGRNKWNTSTWTDR
jgi:hypothetical protein